MLKRAQVAADGRPEMLSGQHEEAKQAQSVFLYLYVYPYLYLYFYPYLYLCFFLSLHLYIFGVTLVKLCIFVVKFKCLFLGICNLITSSIREIFKGSHKQILS